MQRMNPNHRTKINQTLRPLENREGSGTRKFKHESKARPPAIKWNLIIESNPARWSPPISRSTSTARQLICCRLIWRIKGRLLVAFSWLMRRAYPALFSFQEVIESILEGFFTASTAEESAMPKFKN